VKPELAAQLWPDLVRRPRDERLAECGFGPDTLRLALQTTRRNLKQKDNADAQLRAADQVYKLAGVYAPSEQAGRSGPGRVIVNLPDLRALFVSITPADAALPSRRAESETVINDAELA
jgi:hypothetical protein